MSDGRTDRDSYATPSTPNPALTPAPPVQGPPLFGRKFSVVVADASGKGLELADFRCVFHVAMWESSTPNTLDLTINNVKKATADQMKKEFTRVRVMAGYAGQYGIIFDGTIIQSRYGRDNPPDSYLKITASDGDRAHVYAVLNETVAAGATPADVHARACTAMNPHGVTQGYTADMPGPAMPRGQVFYGNATEIMTRNTRASGTQWTILDGRVQVIPQYGYLPNEAVVLTAKTGLIGLPQQTEGGILVKALLNPLLRVNNRIKIDNASVQEARIGSGLEAQASKFKIPKIDSDGLYRILALSHNGDTRGQNWFTEMICLSVDPNGWVPESLLQRGYGGTGAVPAASPPAPLPTPPTPPATPPASPPTPTPPPASTPAPIPAPTPAPTPPAGAVTPPAPLPPQPIPAPATPFEPGYNPFLS